MIWRQQAHQSYKLPHANETVFAEFDLTEQIYITHRDYHIAAIFLNVCGHKDKNKANSDLLLYAQLNIDADTVAGEYQNYCYYQSIAPLLPLYPAVLSMRRTFSTNDYNRQLLHVATEPGGSAYPLLFVKLTSR